MVAKSTTRPATRPPSTICLVVLELARKENGDKDLVDGTLNGDNADDAQNCMRCIPSLEEPLCKR